LLFQEIIGLYDVKQTLTQAVQNQHIAHALLFVGREGCANLPLALAFAQYLHCENRSTKDACGRCASCRKYEKLIHPDLHFVFPVAITKKVASKPLSQDYLPEWRKTILKNPYFGLTDWLNFIEAENKQGNISVEESRQIIQTLALKTYEGEFKILLMWLPEMMNIQSANALLKILEEPPPKTIFLLVSNDSKSLLTTIISRVQMVQIPSFSDADIQTYLAHYQDLSPEKAHDLAYLADGNLSEAIRLSHDTVNDNHILFRDWMRSCYKKDVADLVNKTDEFAGLSKESQKNLLIYGLGVCRESLIMLANNEKLLRLSGAKLDFIRGFAKTMSFEKLEFVYQQLNEAIYHLERNANAKILFLDMSLQLAARMRS
jgi:DNA polymerase-3 subunit delta'